MNPSEITIFDVYNAVDPTSLENLIGVHKNPSPECPVGCKIHDVLEEPYNAVREGVKDIMSKSDLRTVNNHIIGNIYFKKKFNLKI